MEDELIKIWQSSPNRERIKFEKSRLILEVRSNLDRFHRAVKIRDITETDAAIFGIPFFAYQVYAIPFQLSKIASGLIVLWLIYVIYRLRRAKRNKPGNYSDTYIDYLRKSKKYLGIQKKLSDSLLYWYILPCLFAVVLFILGAYLGGRADKQVFMRMIIFVIATGVAVFLWNRRAIKKQITPRLKKIDELLQVMEE